MREKKKTTFRKLEYHHKESFYLIVRGVEVGIAAGIVTVLYRYLLSCAEKWLMAILDCIRGNPAKIAVWLVSLALLGFFVSKIIKWEPNSGGSGIPQVIGEIKGYLNPSWCKTIAGKLVGGTLSVFAGLSLGREGPSVQLGAMAAKGIARLTKADKTTELRMISCGAGAGIASAFNSPLAGIMFVLEEIHRTFDKSILCIGIMAAVTADFISKFFFGQNTIFQYDTENIPLRYYWLLVIMGALLGVIGVLYNIIMIKGSQLYKKLKLPNEIKLSVIFLISGIVGLFLPEVLCGGHSMVGLLLNERPGIMIMLALFLAKFLFGALSFSSGAPGGTLYPLTILGAYLGAVYGDVVIGIFGLKADLWQEFLVVGMAGLFASIVRAPITGIVIVFEITGNMNNILPLVVVSLISYAVANTIGNTPFYSALLEGLIAGRDNELEAEPKINEKVLQTFVIPTGSKISGKAVSDIDWGKHCLIVSIERGEVSITPKGGTLLKEGDTLVVMVSQRRFGRDISRLERIINGG